MKGLSTGQRASILHLSGGGDLSNEISRQLAEANLRAQVMADPYRAMGWLAGLRPTRAKVAIVDYACLADDTRDFPRLAMALTTASMVYLCGDRAAVEADPAMTRSGARIITTSPQVKLMIVELERLAGHHLQAGEALELEQAGAADTDRGAQVPSDGAADRPGTLQLDLSEEVPAESPPEQDAAESAPAELRVIEPASYDVKPEVDALADAASQRWPEPVLDVAGPGDEPIAKILPDHDQEESPEEVPTPWSPSTRRPERTPPRADAAEKKSASTGPEPSATDSNEPILTPEELEALLGPQDQA